jgi:hypothetical protein
MLLAGTAGCFLTHDRNKAQPEATIPEPPADDAALDAATVDAPDMPPDRDPPDAAAPAQSPDAAPTTPPEPTFTLAGQPTAIEAEPGYVFLQHHEILGDLDGDGVDDFVLFANRGPLGIFPASVPSAAYVFYGRADLPSQLDAVDADAALRGDGFAAPTFFPAAGALGDVNGDGLADLVIAGTRSVYFAFGSPQRLSGEHAIDDVTTSWTFAEIPNPIMAPPVPMLLAAIGDLHGDGISDFALTLQTGTHEEQYPSGVSYTPVLSTFLVSGQSGSWPSGAFDPAWASAELTAPEGTSGCTVSTAADLDGDGDSDLLVFVDNQLRLLRGGEEAPTGTVLASEAGIAFSSSVQVNRLPDIDGDGSDELAWKDFSGLPNTYVTYGGGGLLAQPALEPDLDVGGDELFVGTMTAADLDGDGAEDLIVATSGLPIDPDPTPVGGIYVVPGGGAPWSGQLVLADRHLLLAGNDGDGDGPVIGRFGNSIDAGGDVTGDGITDLLATTMIEDGSALGRSRVLLIPGGLKRSAR